MFLAQISTVYMHLPVNYFLNITPTKDIRASRKHTIGLISNPSVIVVHPYCFFVYISCYSDVQILMLSPACVYSP